MHETDAPTSEMLFLFDEPKVINWPDLRIRSGKRNIHKKGIKIGFLQHGVSGVCVSQEHSET